MKRCILIWFRSRRSRNTYIPCTRWFIAFVGYLQWMSVHCIHRAIARTSFCTPIKCAFCIIRPNKNALFTMRHSSGSCPAQCRENLGQVQGCTALLQLFHICILTFSFVHHPYNLNPLLIYPIPGQVQ